MPLTQEAVSSPPPLQSDLLQLSRQPCDMYFVWRPNRDWAHIIISPGGLLSIVSDYGNYAYIWTNHGCPSFKHFLAEMKDPDYFLNKLCGGRKEFDPTRSLSLIRGTLDSLLAQEIEVEYDGTKKIITEELIKDIVDEIGDFASECSESEDLFVERVLNEYPWLSDYAIDGIAVRVHDQMAVLFVERLWPLFIEKLKEELAPVAAAAVAK